MKEKIRWNDFVSALDYTTTHKKTHSILSWQSWEQDSTGISFQCQIALGKQAQVRVILSGLKLSAYPPGISLDPGNQEYAPNRHCALLGG